MSRRQEDRQATQDRASKTARRKAARRRRPAIDELKFMHRQRLRAPHRADARRDRRLDAAGGRTASSTAWRSGEFRVAEPDGQGGWKVNEWLKKAVLLYFRMQRHGSDRGATRRRSGTRCRRASPASTKRDFRKLGARVVPGAIARRGAYIGKDVVLMPSFVNIGAHVGEGTMVDTWATVGSCAQIGKHCHLSGGAGIGGVLEPLQASPTIIEDHCFIGARSEVVEGVVVGHHSVIGMGVFLGQSTRIYNRMTGEISYGYVPPGSVVVSGSAAGEGRLALAVLRGDRQAGGREDARQDQRSTTCCAAWRIATRRTRADAAPVPGLVSTLIQELHDHPLRPQELRHLQEGAQLAGPLRRGARLRRLPRRSRSRRRRCCTGRQALGGWDAMVNKSSTTWRNLPAQPQDAGFGCGVEAAAARIPAADPPSGAWSPDDGVVTQGFTDNGFKKRFGIG